MTGSGSDTERVLLLRRPFGWGILVIHDRIGLPRMPDGWTGDAVAADEHGAILPVHHAQDVELAGLSDDVPVPQFEVEVECFVGARADGRVQFDGVLACPDGRIQIGDADGEYELRLAPGAKRVQAALDPVIPSDRVTIWISEA
jgi:hypothetical protein